MVDPGRRVYVRRVNIGGNTRTRDEVIRREMRQYEGAWFDSDRVRLSRDRIDRLGYFETVTVDTPAVPTAPDQVDVNVTVKERATGNIQVGAGYSSAEGIVLSAGTAQQNLFGTGNALSFEINTSKANRVFAIAHTDPYVTPEGISRTIELYDRKSDLAELGLASVGYSTRGAGLVFGVPFTEFDRVFFGLRYEDTEIDLTPLSPLRYIEYVQQFGETSDALALTDRMVARQPRQPPRADARPIPARFRRGGLPVLDLQYYRLTYQFQQYFPLSRRLTLASTARSATATATATTRTRSSRTSTSAASAACAASKAATLGPRDIDGDPLGGTRRFNFSFEAYVPIPGADRTLRGPGVPRRGPGLGTGATARRFGNGLGGRQCERQPVVRRLREELDLS